MIRKKSILVLIMAFVPLLLMAQVAGGQIRRKQTNTTAAAAKKTQSSVASKKSNSGKRSSAPETPPRRANTGVIQPQKNQIIQNLVNNMVYVEGGTFMMGATSEQGSDADGDEKPAHRVTLSSFYIGMYEVTQEEWLAVMDSNPSDFKGAKRPVENVSWNDCQVFIRKLNQMTGGKFRLPTEAEWEYAARGGNKSLGYKFAGSSNLGYVAWSDEKWNAQTHDVGQKHPNELGLYDVSGNVWEWCQDWYDINYYSTSPQMKPIGPSTGSVHVLRGGSLSNNAWYCRVSNRTGEKPGYQSNNLGLRLAH